MPRADETLDPKGLRLILKNMKVDYKFVDFSPSTLLTTNRMLGLLFPTANRMARQGLGLSQAEHRQFRFVHPRCYEFVYIYLSPLQLLMQLSTLQEDSTPRSPLYGRHCHLRLQSGCQSPCTRVDACLILQDTTTAKRGNWGRI